MTDAVKREIESRVVGHTGQGCDAVKMGRDCEVVGRVCNGRMAARKNRTEICTEIKLFLNFITPEWDNFSLKHYSKLTNISRANWPGQLQ